MPHIANTSEIPLVSDGFHVLRIESIEAVEGYKYNEPETPETRLKVQLRVLTPGEEQVSFVAWMSQNLAERATLGSIYRAVTGSAPPRGGIESEDLIGGTFQHYIGHNDNGWPRLVAGTAAPYKSEKLTAAAAFVGGTNGDEPPFARYE